MKQKIAKIIIFILCLSLLILGISQILKYKSNDGIDQMQAFYTNEENSIDVLFMGSSHCYSNINTGVLYDEFGIAGFDYGGAEQLLWNNYFWLIEALKTQKPKLIVLDLFSTGVIKDDFQGAWMMENIYGMESSENYYDSVKISTLDPAFDTYILPFTRYHSRYAHITKEDFQYEEYLESFKGFEPKWSTTSSTGFTAPDVSGVTEMTPISEKAERYLRRYIELCIKEDIPLLFINAPYMVTEDAQKIYNYMFSIAEEYDIPYLDFNKMYEELELNFDTDMCEWSHLNEIGNVKYTTYLGNYIKEHYEIPDRRGDEAYITWKEDADRWKQELNFCTLPKVRDAAEYIKALNNPYYTLIVTMNDGNDFTLLSPNMKQELKKLGIDETALGQRVYIIRDKQVLFQSAEEEYEWYTSFEKGDIIVNREIKISGDNTEIKSKAYINGAEYDTTGQPFMITVYDNFLNIRVGTVGMNPADGYSAIQ